MIKLSIIILNWNTKELLMQCINSLVSSLPAGKAGIKYQVSSIEIIIVDNNSTDGSVEALEKYLIQNTKYLIHLIKNQANLGFSKGNNIALRQAQGEYIMLLNSDTIVKEGAIQKLIDYLEKNPDTAVSPLLKLPDGKPQADYYMRFPNLWQIFLYHNPLIRPLAMNTPLKTLFCQQAKEEPFEVDQLPGAALVAPRETWEKVGSLDPDFKFLWEDVDWSWRAKKKGIKLMVLPEAEIIHFGGASWKKKLRRDKNFFYKQFFASMLLFIRKNYSSGQLKIFKTAIAINFLITFKLSLFLDLINGEFKQEKLWE